MRRQLDASRLGLIIGAGVNRPIGFPDWETLVRRIAEHPDVNGTAFTAEIGKTPLPILIQILLQHYGSLCSTVSLSQARNERDKWRLIGAGFRRIMHECLYQDVPSSDDELRVRDRFFTHFLAAVRSSPMTVTYNFDDTLERLLLTERGEQERTKSRGFETITDARQQFRLAKGVIYHPNGYLPRNLLEATSQPVIFSEESLADQLLESLTGQYSTLLHHFSKTTCVFVGLSLDDPTLRHLLRQGAKLNPGHYHYLVSYVPQLPGELTLEQEARSAANFEMLNLITLFLSEEGIASLGRLLSSDPQDLQQLSDDEGINLSYCFYLTGVPGVGKTTTLSYFKNLVTYDEWLEELLPEMSRPWKELSSNERSKVDTWILQQVGLKNRRLVYDAQENRVGIALVDRCVPDAIAFTPTDEWSAKAHQLIAAVSPGRSTRRVHPGQVILLVGDPAEIAIRAGMSGKETTKEATEELQRDTCTVYLAPGVTRLDVRDMSIAEVVRSVADIIHRQDYEACALHGLLEYFRNHGYDQSTTVPKPGSEP